LEKCELTENVWHSREMRETWQGWTWEKRAIGKCQLSTFCDCHRPRRRWKDIWGVSSVELNWNRNATTNQLCPKVFHQQPSQLMLQVQGFSSYLMWKIYI